MERYRHTPAHHRNRRRRSLHGQLRWRGDVPAGVTLTIAPGTVVKSQGGSDIEDFGTYEDLSVEGTLDAVGTSASPITFTSINDNTIGGDTGTGSPAVGDWGGIVLTDRDLSTSSTPRSSTRQRRSRVRHRLRRISQTT